METLDPQKSSAKEAEVSQSTGAEAEETVGKDSTDAVRGEGQELSAGDERNVGVGEAGATADAEEEKSIDGDGHVAVEADCTPAGFVDPVVESGVEMEPSDAEEDLGDTSNLSAEERNQLFARGLSREKAGKKDAALKCYLGCLSGLSRHTRFVLLPQCLRNIAEIYYQNQEYDRAIHFIQAEKLYYENALISTEEIQKKLEELSVTLDDQPDAQRGQDDARTVETLRAEEYEHLAKLCLDKKQPQLALEYAGKCTKLRQQIFGENHAKTQESLDFFATVYAEVGKQQYADSMETLDNPDAEPVPLVTDSEGSAPSTPTGDGTPVSILRNRKNSEREKKQVRFHESVVDNSLQREQEEWLSRTVVALLLFVCCFFLTILGLGLYCRAIDSHLCRSLGEVAHDAYLSVRYQYYKYTSTKHVKFA